MGRPPVREAGAGGRIHGGLGPLHLAHGWGEDRNSYVECGIAQLGALQVWRNSQRDQTGAVAAYRRALAFGGTRPLTELFAAAGALRLRRGDRGGAGRADRGAGGRTGGVAGGAGRDVDPPFDPASSPPATRPRYIGMRCRHRRASTSRGGENSQPTVPRQGEGGQSWSMAARVRAAIGAGANAAGAGV